MTGDGVALVLAAAVAALFVLALLFGAATLALRARNERRARRWARLEAEWTPLVLAVLSGDVPAAAPGVPVARADRPLFVDFLLRLVRRLKGPERDALVALAAPYLDEVAARARRGGAERRALAVQQLGALGAGRHAATVVAALDDRSALVAMTAARVLAPTGRAEHAAAILDHLARFREWSPGFLAALLATMGAGAAPSLRALLADPARSPGERAVAAEALRIMHDLPAADAARAAVAAGGDADLSAAALRLLAAVGGAADAPAVRAACRSADPVVRAQAAAALGAIGGAADRAALAAALDDPSPWVVLHAARSLKALGGDAQLAAAGRPGAGLARLAAAE